MVHLIDKDALVAEIEKLQCPEHGYCLDKLLDFINTLEVKEVDLEKEIDTWYQNEASKEFENVFYSDIENCAQHFFELGIKLAQKGE